MKDLIIIGAGIAGLTAAIFALRAGINVTVIESDVYGGQATLTNEIENYPGFEKISGAELAQIVYNQAEKLGAEFIFDEVKSINFANDVKTVNTSGQSLNSRAVIIANGLKRRTLGCKGESEFTGRGVSYCATCDGSFFKDKPVVVIGGGNTALEDAIYLSNVCSKVTLIVRKDHFKGEDYLIKSVEKIPNIEIIMKSNIKEINGNKSVESIVVVHNNGDTIEIPISGIFVAIGYQPQNEIYKGQVHMDEIGYFISDETCMTNVPGVYVAGDCRMKMLRQLVTAASDGAVAGNQASKFIMQSK